MGFAKLEVLADCLPNVEAMTPATQNAVLVSIQLA